VKCAGRSSDERGRRHFYFLLAIRNGAGQLASARCSDMKLGEQVAAYGKPLSNRCLGASKKLRVENPPSLEELVGSASFLSPTRCGQTFARAFPARSFKTI